MFLLDITDIKQRANYFLDVSSERKTRNLTCLLWGDRKGVVHAKMLSSFINSFINKLLNQNVQIKVRNVIYFFIIFLLYVS